MSTADLAAAPRSLFIVSPSRDFVFFFLSVSAVLIAWFCAAVLQVSSFYILGAVAVMSNGPHLISTWTRVYFDPREWRGRPLLLIGVPMLIAGFVVFANLALGTTGTRILNSTILYWATWHFVAQNWGILRIYQRKSGEPETSVAMRLEKPMLMLFVLWCLLHRIYTGPRMLFGTEVYWVDLPLAAVDGLLGPISVLFVIYAVQRIRERNRPWARAAGLRAAFLGCAVIGFFVPFRFITTDDTSAFAAAACWHGFQYLGIVRHYHRTTWKAQGLGRDTWGGVVWVSLTLSHYWLDGVIWKLRRPELAARVGL